jgi:hypothetical protein
MAGQLTNLAERKVLDVLFGGTALTAFTPMFLGLTTDAAGVTNAKNGGTFTEVSGGSYARLSIANTIATGTWAAATGTAAALATKAMGATAVWTFVTPTGSWGTVNGFFIADAVTAGNIWYYDDLTTPQTISSGNTVSFANGTVTITLT